MKKILILLSIALLSPASNAENSLLATTATGKEAISSVVKTESGELANLESAKNDANNSSLWEILDTNKDNMLSKAEAVASQDVADNWNKLDLNKDEKLDTEEFAKIFSLEN